MQRGKYISYINVQWCVHSAWLYYNAFSLFYFPHPSNHTDFKCQAELRRCFTVAVQLWILGYKSPKLCRPTKPEPESPAAVCAFVCWGEERLQEKGTQLLSTSHTSLHLSSQGVKWKHLSYKVCFFNYLIIQQINLTHSLCLWSIMQQLLHLSLHSGPKVVANVSPSREVGRTGWNKQKRILYYTILQHTILYCTILQYTILLLYLYYTILTIPYNTTPHYTIIHYTIPHHTILYYMIPYYTTLHYTIQYYKAVLQCIAQS